MAANLTTSTAVSDSSESTSTESISCEFDRSAYIQAQYWLIAVFGTSVCAVGIGFNIALLQVLFQPKLRRTYFIYLAVLAIMDILILITYILVPVIGILFEYYEDYVLYRLWHAAVRYFYTLSRIVTLASTYLVLACSVERYWEVVQLHTPIPPPVSITQSKRYTIVASVVAFTVLFRFVVLFELDIAVEPSCYGTLAYVRLVRTPLVHNYFYDKIYSFWIVHVVQVFFPFPALVLLNGLIIISWRAVLRTRRKQSVAMKRLIERSRSARQMMVSLVTTYLACNTLQMVITCWEHISPEFLERHSDFYAFAADVVTLSTAICASTRLPIYYASNLGIRVAIRELWFTKKVLVYAGSLRRLSSMYKRPASRKRAYVLQQNQREVNENEEKANQSMIGGDQPRVVEPK